MKISRKKIFIAAIMLFCIFLLIILGLELKQKAGEKKEIQVQECIKEIGKTDFSELINLTEDLSKDSIFCRNEKIDIYAHPFSLLWEHLQCKFSQEQNEEKKNALVDYAMEARRRILYRNRNEGREKTETRQREIFIHPEESFARNLALGNTAEICPNRLPVLCRKNNGVFFRESDEWCSRICETLAQYEKDKDKLNKEVTNFTDWDEGISGVPSSPFLWRLAVAYRFGGKDSALKICDNVDEAQGRDYCLDTAVILFETEGLTCEAVFEQLAQLICDYKYK